MSSLAIGLALALIASVALNGSFVIQHVGTLTAPPINVRRPLATLVGLFRSRAWVAGAALGMARRVGSFVTPSVRLARGRLVCVFVVSILWKGILAGLSPFMIRPIMWPATTPPSAKSG